MRDFMKRAIIFFCFIELTCFCISAETINLEEARTLALANSRSIAKYNMAIRSSELDQRSQLYSMLPSPSAEYSLTMNYLERDWGFVNPIDTLNTGLTFSITQKIFEGGKNFVQRSLSSIAAESVRNEALTEYFNVLDATDNAYYTVLEAAANLEAAESSLQTAILSLSMAEIRQSSGMINQGDYLRALADKEDRENSRNQARRNLIMNTAKFNTLTGISKTPEFEPVDFNAYENLILRLAGISDEEANALYEKFWEIFAQANPSLARAALNSRRAEKNFSLSKRDYAPTISATIFSTGLNYSTANGFSNWAGGGISIRGSIPIDVWVLANRVQKNRISRDSAALDYVGAEVSLENDLYSALLGIFAQAESVLSSRRSLDYSEKHFEYVMERYRLSQSSVSDLGDASSLYINSRNNAIKAQYGFLQSLSRLRSLGAINEEEKLINILLNN